MVNVIPGPKENHLIGGNSDNFNLENKMDKVYQGTPFSIKTFQVENGKGYWNSTRIEIYRGTNLIGEYLRNYNSYAHKTFLPFKIQDQWYALYSKEYTALRVARLTDKFEDWCGEENSAEGFCPVELYIPIKYTEAPTKYIIGEKVIEYQNSEYLDNRYKSEKEFWKDVSESDIESLEYLTWGLMSGCQWGDDNSWKIRYIDLSKVPEKILNITEKFGYFEMSNELDLRESVRIRASDDSIDLTGAQYFDLSKITEHEED